MKVAFVSDPANADGTIGGAELTLSEFAAAAPEGVELSPMDEAQAVVVGNCVTFGESLRSRLSGKRVVRYFNDLDPVGNLRDWFLENATCIFTSPLHLERFPGEPADHRLIPPAVPLSDFYPPRQHRRNGKRKGTVSVATWQNPGKGAPLVERWAQEHGPVAVYGTGPWHPVGPNIVFCGPLEYRQIPQVLWGFERFLFLPTAVEPFGRSVVEADAAGCELVVNRNVGATYWLNEKPLSIETAASKFWEVVCG